jgi:mRNA interferase RelE/StbE
VALYSLFIKPSAGKELEAVGSKRDRLRIIWKIHDLSGDPRPNSSEKLAGYDDRYRVRQGNYRIVYAIDDKASHVTIYRIGHRKDVYRRAV